MAPNGPLGETRPKRPGVDHESSTEPPPTLSDPERILLAGELEADPPTAAASTAGAWKGGETRLLRPQGVTTFSGTSGNSGGMDGGRGGAVGTGETEP